MANSNNNNTAQHETADKPKQRVMPKDPLTGKPRPKTWREKIQDGDPLNRQDETKADADFNFRERQRQQKARAEFEAMKNRGTDHSYDPSSFEPLQEDD